MKKKTIPPIDANIPPVKVVKRKVGRWTRYYLLQDRNGHGAYYTQAQFDETVYYGKSFGRRFEIIEENKSQS